MFVLIVINAWIFKPHGIVSFDNYSILTVYLPEFIVAGILSKRKGISMIVAMIDAFVTFYLLVLLRNLSSAFFNNVFTEYVFYLSFVPLLFVYLKFFYTVTYSITLTPKINQRSLLNHGLKILNERMLIV